MKKCTAMALCFFIFGCQQNYPSDTTPINLDFIKLPKESCATTIPSGYKISNINDFVSKLSTLKLQKDDFETEIAYHQRLNNQLLKLGIDPNKTYYFSKRLDPESIKYDLDSGTLTIKSYEISNDSDLFGMGSNLYKVGIEFLYDKYNDTSLNIHKLKHKIGSYIGQNAFGARVLVTQYREDDFGIAQKALADPKSRERKIHSSDDSIRRILT